MENKFNLIFRVLSKLVRNSDEFTEEEEITILEEIAKQNKQVK